MTAFGAQRKHVTLPTDFRSPSENGHSRYGQLTARFAPKSDPHRSRSEPPNWVWIPVVRRQACEEKVTAEIVRKRAKANAAQNCFLLPPPRAAASNIRF